MIAFIVVSLMRRLSLPARWIGPLPIVDVVLNGSRYWTENRHITAACDLLTTTTRPRIVDINAACPASIGYIDQATIR
jgi:hypothetical protein